MWWVSVRIISVFEENACESLLWSQFCAPNTESGKQTSLRTADEAVADQMLAVRNGSFEHSQINFVLAKAYLDAADPALAMRQWQVVSQQTGHCHIRSAKRRLRHTRSKSYAIRRLNSSSGFRYSSDGRTLRAPSLE